MSASSPIIPPQGTAEVEVRYRAPQGNKDQVHRVMVEFKEDAPMVCLQIRSRVREALCIFPEKVQFDRVGRGQQAERSCEVYNYGDRDIEITSIASSYSWLTGSAQFIRSRSDPKEPRQTWLLTVRVSANGLGPGKHQGLVKIQTSSGETKSKALPVEVTVSSPLEAIPGQVFLGTVQPGSANRYRLLLHFTPESSPRSVEEISVEHNLGAELQVSCEQRGNDRYELAVVYKPKVDSEGFVEGIIHVTVEKDGVPALDIPFSARVRLE
jgi:hypothetical protein